MIATIDTEGVASSAAGQRLRLHRCAAAAAPAAATGGAMSGVAMPAAAKLMADNQLAAGIGAPAPARTAA